MVNVHNAIHNKIIALHVINLIKIVLFVIINIIPKMVFVLIVHKFNKVVRYVLMLIIVRNVLGISFFWINIMFVSNVNHIILIVRLVIRSSVFHVWLMLITRQVSVNFVIMLSKGASSVEVMKVLSIVLNALMNILFQWMVVKVEQELLLWNFQIL